MTTTFTNKPKEKWAEIQGFYQLTLKTNSTYKKLQSALYYAAVDGNVEAIIIILNTMTKIADETAETWKRLAQLTDGMVTK